MKKIVSVLIAAAFISLSAPIASAQKYTVYDQYTHSGIDVDVNTEKDGLKGTGNAMVKVQNGEISPFTGFAKTKKGTYCYNDGIKWQGWYKQSGKWYYFDPENDGLMSVKTAKTPVGTYYLDENGAWNGKISKAAKRPPDFSLSLSWYGYVFEYYISTSDSEIKYDNFISEQIETVKKVNISEEDMQIIYDELMSSGVCGNGMRGFVFYGEEIAKSLDRKNYAAATDLTSFELAWQLNNAFGDLNGDYSMLDFYSESIEVQRCSHLLRFAQMYMTTFPGYREIVAEENEYIKAHKYDEAPFNELTEVKTKSADIYKFRGFVSPSGGRTRLITSKAELDELISMLKKEGINENTVLYKRLSGYTDEYFRENAVVFGDFTASSGSLEFDDPKLYTGYSNIYLSVTGRLPETYTCDLCYAAAVAEASKKQLGCETVKPPVIWRYNTNSQPT